MSNQKNQTKTRDLLQLARERGYVFTKELNPAFQISEDASEEVDELLSALERDGGQVYEDAAEAIAASAGADQAANHENTSASEDTASAQAPGPPEQVSDPVRTYLREMGTRERSRQIEAEALRELGTLRGQTSFACLCKIPND